MRVLLVLVLAGCSHASIDASSNTLSSDKATGARVALHVESRSLAAVLVAGMFIAAAADFSDGFVGAPRAELDPARPVREQDCTRPIELGANLRCR